MRPCRTLAQRAKSLPSWPAVASPDVQDDLVEIRRFDSNDLNVVVEFSLRAWEPVFESLRSVLGEGIFLRLHPDWRADQAEAVTSSCTSEDRDVFVAVVNHRPVGFVAVGLNAFQEQMGWIEINRR